MNSKINYKIYSLGESALTIDFGNEISVELNQTVLNLAQQIEKRNFAGFIECVPAYSSLTIFYDLVRVRKSQETFSNAFEAIKSFVEKKIVNLEKIEEEKNEVIEIPVSFEPENALNIDFVAESHHIDSKEVKKKFLSKTYRVFMLGFLPGFAYMGKVDEKIATPRKETPRTKVPKGSIGIAGNQTGIYPLESPGGWQIIGKTEVELFTPNDERPTLFKAGDLVKFVEI